MLLGLVPPLLLLLLLLGSCPRVSWALLNRSQLLSVCHGKYGCFSIDHPWYSSRRLINVFPHSPKEIHPSFKLYTQYNPTEGHHLLDGYPDSISSSHFQADKITYLITHGYLEHGQKDWVQRMKNELLRHGHHNVIILSWLGGSHPPYSQATANTRLVGAMAAHLLYFLKHETGIDLARVHVIGHSLGAHLAGYIGATLKKDFGLELGRITGLDPAEPYFEHTDPIVRLDPSDAFYVDVIHTNANPITEFGLGMWQPVGHLDFYPNGGRVMAGCNQGFIANVIEEKGNLPYALRRMFGCNHIRAYEYFIESINSHCKFIAVPCSSWEAFYTGSCGSCAGPDQCFYMGLPAFDKFAGRRPQSHPISLYLMTEEKQPFCAYHYRVTLVLSDTPESIRQQGDRGHFFLILHGKEENSHRVRLNPEEQYFEPGRTYHFIIVTQDLGHVHSADLIWQYSGHPLNPLTWRLSSASKMFVNRVEVEEFGHAKKHTFCANDSAFISGKAGHVDWQPYCRTNSPDPGSSVIGSVLNLDPMGVSLNLLEYANPFSYNPINGIANVESGFQGISQTLHTLGRAAPRLGQKRHPK